MEYHLTACAGFVALNRTQELGRHQRVMVRLFLRLGLVIRRGGRRTAQQDLVRLVGALLTEDTEKETERCEVLPGAAGGS